MHKLAKGLKKKNKKKKGKKGEEEEFDPEELEKYRREHAEPKEPEEAEGEGKSDSNKPAAGSEEWKKFQALTAGIDSVLKKTQEDLDRIKEESFYQRKVVEPEPEPEEDPAVTAAKEEQAKRYLGFDKDGNPIEAPTEEEKKDKFTVNAEGFVEIPDDEEEHNDFVEEDIFDTTYIDVLQNTDVQLAYIPESPTEEELGDDPFDTTNADKVLKTVDKKGKKVVSLGNAVEVLAGRVDQTSISKVNISRSKRVRPKDLLLSSFDEGGGVEADEAGDKAPPAEVEIQRTLLDDDSDLPDIPIDLSQLPPCLPRPITPADPNDEQLEKKQFNIVEFELLQEKTLLEEIPDLDEEEFDLAEPVDTGLILEEDDPFKEKETEQSDIETQLLEASFAAASFVNEEDPFDTTIAENILPGKAELKFIEKELHNVQTASIALKRPYESITKNQQSTLTVAKKDLLGGSATDLTKLSHQPIKPVEEVTYVDPFDTSKIKDIPPGKTELKFIEKELLGEKKSALEALDDDDFDPREGEEPKPVTIQSTVTNPGKHISDRRPSRPEALDIHSKVVAFNVPSPGKSDLLAVGEEQKTFPAKPLTPYYPQKSIEEAIPIDDEAEEVEVDPFDTSYVKNNPGKTELKIIESELLQGSQATEIKDEDFDPRSDSNPTSIVKSSEVIETLVRKTAKLQKRQESILDTEVDVQTEHLTPKVKPGRFDEEEECYADPFDTSIASNIGPGKIEIKLLESELNQVTEQPIRNNPVIELLSKRTSVDDSDFDPRAEAKQDILSADDQETIRDKVLTPTLSADIEEEDIDPFDTSFASLGPGKTELKLLESELFDDQHR